MLPLAAQDSIRLRARVMSYFRVPVLSPSQVESGGFRWRFALKSPAAFLALGSDNAEAEGSSPSLPQ